MFKTYKSKPKEVEAAQFTEQNKYRLLDFMEGNVYPKFEDGLPVIVVTTIHGEKATVRLGDWVVKEKTPGCFYPVKPDIFDLSYVKKELNDGGAQT